MALLLTYSVALAAPAASWTTIGTGRSQAHLTDVETVLFEHNATKGAVMNHFWAAGSPSVDNTTVRYYVDGESSASIVFTPALACGVGCAPSLDLGLLPSPMSMRIPKLRPCRVCL